MYLLLNRLPVAVTLVALLAACSTVRDVAAPTSEPAQAASPTPETPPPDPMAKRTPSKLKPAAPEERVFAVQPKSSLVKILVYRSGSLAHLGHNHVVSSTHLQGTVTLAPDVENSTLDLRLPVASLEVDNLGLREQAGKDFTTVPGDSDINSTRRNMLSDKVLDAKRFPQIRIQAGVAGGQLPRLNLGADLQVHGVRKSVKIPVTVAVTGDELTASGEFMVRQSEFGIKPFSVLMGALKVSDELTIQFRIAARARNTYGEE